MTQEAPPAGWEEGEPRYDFQHKAWDELATGNRLLIEVQREQWHGEDEAPDLYVTLVGENWEENPEPIRTVLEQAKDMEIAMQEAHNFMEKRRRRD